MLKIKNYILLSLLALVSVTAMAQRPTVRVTVEPSDIMIGEQAVINLEVISPLGRDIQFPVYPDTLIKNIEVLKMLDVDTTTNELMTLNQKYLITSFDSALYNIPPMLVIVDGKDTIKTNSFGLKVTSPQLPDEVYEYLEKVKNNEVDSLDFAVLQLADIKPIQDAPFVWTDYLAYIYIPLLILLLIAAIVLGIYFWKKKQKKGYFFTPKIIEPPHIVAIRHLDELKAKKLGQKGMEKEYYTELTDIVRTYITGRYESINATEMITEDIIEAVHRNTDGASPEKSLEQLLKLADLVKFAKYTPLPDENDLSMVNAYLFVNQTKMEEVITPEEAKKKAEEERKNGVSPKNGERTKDETTKS